MPADATASDYLSETQSTLAILQAVSGSQQAQAADLETALAELKERYSSASQTSYSLSANLVVEDSSKSPPKIIRLRPTGQMILVGAILGLVAWMIHWLSGGLRARNGKPAASVKSAEPTEDRNNKIHHERPVNSSRTSSKFFGGLWIKSAGGYFYCSWPAYR